MRYLPSFISAFTFATSITAQQPPESIAPVVVTAARASQSIDELLADVTVISNEDVRRAGQSTLAELLQRQPGVEIVTNGGAGSVSTLLLRGTNRNHTLILIDGLRVASATAGSAAIEAIPLSSIERIEILRGVASALYGADAIGGVIHIITRRDASRGGSVEGGAGSYRSSRLSADLAGNTTSTRYAIGAGHRRSDGFNAIENRRNFSHNPDADGYENTHVTGSVEYAFSERAHMAARVFRSWLRSDFDATSQFNDRAETELTTVGAEIRNRWSDRWKSIAQLGRGIDDSTSTTSFGESVFRTEQTQYAWQHDVAWDGNALQLAVERREERVTGTVAYDASARTTNSAVAIYRIERDIHRGQLNLRHDRSTQFGNRTTGGVAYGYRFNSAVRSYASIGTAFKAPTFNDLYFPGFSNPNLRPEIARSAELALIHESRSQKTQATVFSNRIRDLILFQCDIHFNCAPQNIRNARISGVTLAHSAQFGSTHVKGSVDWQRPLDDGNDKVLPRRARRHAVFTLRHGLGAWQLGGEWIVSGARYDDADNAARMGGYGILNLMLDYAWSTDWRVSLRANNLLNKRYELARDYGVPRQDIFVWLQYRI